MMKRLWMVAFAIAAAMASRVVAEDVYFHRALGDVELTEGELPTTDEPNWGRGRRNRDRPAYAVLDGEGEVYVRYSFNARRTVNARERVLDREIAVRVPRSRDVTGRLFLPKWDDEGMQVLLFRIPAQAAHADARRDFYELKLDHYENLLSRGVPGAAWFRHESRQAQEALGKALKDLAPARPQIRRRRTRELSETYALFTGGRAMSENLQLDRVLRPDEGGEKTVDVDTIEGITIREIDWKPLIKGGQVELDPLAARIPSDQHAIFFPSFHAAVAMADEMAAHGAPILQLAEPRSTSARTFERYQRQMCLAISDIARLLGPKVAQRVAVTGSDPYFRTGTDVAVLFEAADPSVLEQLLMAQVSLAAAEHGNARPINGEIDGLAYRGFLSDDRSIRSYIAKMDGLVIVTNSPFQLEQLIRVTNGKTKSLASLDEFAFFRTRYRRGDEGETAFLFLSDATIRRWCGPRWRIATSRRTRDAAVLAEMQASQLDRLVEGNVQAGPLYTNLPIAGDGQLTLAADGVHGATIGSLAFITPIAEMKIDQVTKAEADAYRQWRDRYQSNWRWAFDPIGIRLGLHKQKLVGDLTVMPLIWGSDYRRFISVSQGAEFEPEAGDLHDTLAHVIMAINTESPALQQQTNMFRAMTGTQLEPLSWLGDAVSAYLDQDPFWKDLAEVPRKDVDEFMEEQGWRIPLAVRAEVANGFKLTAFLAAVRGFIEQASPGMLHWESLTYNDEPYVKITPTERAIGRTEEVRRLALYYCASGKSLTITFNQDVLKRSIDREIARGQAEAKSARIERPALERTWIGSNLALQVDQQFLQVLASIGRDEYQRAMQSRAWGNLAILNQWKQRYPDRDPVALHEQFWQDRLLCPGGGRYVWNAAWQTMESTVYGCPGAPKDGPLAPPLLNTVQRGSFGLTFEEQGLRARVSLLRWTAPLSR